MSPEEQGIVIAIITLLITFFGILAGTTIAYVQLRHTPMPDTEAQPLETALFRAAPFVRFASNIMVRCTRSSTRTDHYPLTATSTTSAWPIMHHQQQTASTMASSASSMHHPTLDPTTSSESAYAVLHQATNSGTMPAPASDQ